MVTKLITSFAPFSDHRAITVSLQLENKKLEAAWKLNNSFLKEEDFRNWITSVIKRIQEEGRGELPHKVWEELKQQVRAEAKDYGKKRGADKRKELKRLETKLDGLLRLADGEAEDLVLISSIQQVEDNIREWYEAKAEAMKIRSRADWFEKDEKMSKFFFDMYKARDSSPPLTELQGEDGETLTEDEDIANYVHSFYSNLYTPEGRRREL